MSETFKADLMKLCVSAFRHGNKLKFSSYVHLLYIKQIFKYRHARLILCNLGEVYMFKHGLYISSLEHARMLIGSYAPLAIITLW